MNNADTIEIIRDNYLNPQNYGVPSWTPTHTVTVENPTCGDSLTLYLKLEGEKLTDIAFTAQGCSIAIASASLLYSKLKESQLLNIPELSEADVITLLGFEPTTSRKNCALLPLLALKESLQK